MQLQSELAGKAKQSWSILLAQVSSKLRSRSVCYTASHQPTVDGSLHDRHTLGTSSRFSRCLMYNKNMSVSVSDNTEVTLKCECECDCACECDSAQTSTGYSCRAGDSLDRGEAIS